MCLMLNLKLHFIKISESKDELVGRRISWPVNKKIITEPDSSAG